VIFDTISAAETAFALRKALGPERSWGHFLSDCIRDKTKASEPILLPLVNVKVPGDRCERPRYAKRHVPDFIVDHRATHSRPADADRLHSVAIQIDPVNLSIPWRLRKSMLVSTGKPGDADVAA